MKAANIKDIRIWFGWLLLIGIFLNTGLGCVASHGIWISPIQETQDLYNAAEQFYTKKRFSKAAILYNEYLKLHPDTSLADNALFRLGEIAMESRDYYLSFGLFQDLEKDYPDSELIPSARFKAAQSLFLDSSLNKASEELIRFQKDFPASQYHPQIKLILSEIYFKTRQYAKAKEEAGGLIRLYPESSLKDKALYQLGLSQMYLRETDMALESFKQALKGDLSEEQRQNIFYVLGTLYLTKGDLHAAVEYFSELVKSTNTEERKNRVVQKIEGLLKNKFSEELLIGIIKEHPDDFPGDLAMIEMGSRKFKEEAFEDARYYWEMFVFNFPRHPSIMDIKARLSFFEEEKAETYSGKLGCIAPLTGPLSEYGEKMIRGVKMAIEEYNQEYGASVKLVLFDSQASPDKARKGVELLAHQEKVAAIIGPLLTSTAMAATSVAEETGIPLFTPTATGEGLPEAGRFIFRNCLMNRHQTEALVDYAVEEMGITRFGILFPFNAYGQEMMALFADRVEELGGEVEIIEFYDQDDTDFKEQLVRIHQIEPDALFMPGSYEKVVLIAPQIPFYEPEEIDPNDLDQPASDITEMFPPTELDFEAFEKAAIDNEDEKEKEVKKKPIQLLGTDGWYDERLIKEGGDYVNGAILSVGFYLESPDYRIRQFSSDFQKTYGLPPNLVSAQAYDATNMILEATDGGRASRDTIREKLSFIKNFPGISGMTTILPSGDSKKEPTLLRVKGRRFVPIASPYSGQRFF